MSFQKVVSRVGEVIAFSALPVALIAVVPTEAKAANLSLQNIDQIYIFGDSLSDTGNVFAASGGTNPPSPPYFQGRYSNGPVWVDYLAQDLGLNPIPFIAASGGATATEGINYAFGGATTGSSNVGSPNLPGLQQEINFFTGANPTADPDALYIVWAGANDYLGGGVSNPSGPLGNLSNAITSLAGAGAKNIMVANLPDLGNLPLTNNTPNSVPLNALSGLHNSGLTATLNNLNNTLGSSVNIIPLDVNSLFKTAINQPGNFGFTNVTTACLNQVTGAVCNNQSEYLFWDSVHPTTAAHQLVADAALSALQAQSVPEPSAGLGMLAFGALGARSVLKRKSKKDSRVKISA